MSKRDHFAPHKSSRFEGYYSRIQLEDGSTLAIIFCSVKQATKRRNLILVSYVSRTGTTPSTNTAFKYEFYPEELSMTAEPSANGPSDQTTTPFTLSAPGFGTMVVSPTVVQYNISVPSASLSISFTLTARTPWSRNSPLSGPMGPILHLSRILPLNWHVHSTCSAASYTIVHRTTHLTGTAGLAHIEKNWGASFPKGWLWSQAFSEDGTASLALAGGAALPGIHAYLVGFRSPTRAWDFSPPFTVRIAGISPCMRVRHDSRAGIMEMRVRTARRELRMVVAAPPDSFVPMAAPLRGGHEPGFAYESFRGAVAVRARRRKWLLGKWETVEEVTLGHAEDGEGCAALEFGGLFSHHVRAVDEEA